MLYDLAKSESSFTEDKKWILQSTGNYASIH